MAHMVGLFVPDDMSKWPKIDPSDPDLPARPGVAAGAAARTGTRRMDTMDGARDGRDGHGRWTTARWITARCSTATHEEHRHAASGAMTAKGAATQARPLRRMSFALPRKAPLRHDPPDAHPPHVPPAAVRIVAAEHAHLHAAGGAVDERRSPM